jgi:hypothetical protein
MPFFSKLVLSRRRLNYLKNWQEAKQLCKQREREERISYKRDLHKRHKEGESPPKTGKEKE